MENKILLTHEERMIDHESRISTLENSCKSAWHKIDEQGELLNTIRDIAVEMKQMREDINRMNDRVSSIESVPRKRWNMIVDKALTALVGALVGYVLFRLGLGG